MTKPKQQTGGIVEDTALHEGFVAEANASNAMDAYGVSRTLAPKYCLTVLWPLLTNSSDKSLFETFSSNTAFKVLNINGNNISSDHSIRSVNELSPIFKKKIASMSLINTLIQGTDTLTIKAKDANGTFINTYEDVIRTMDQSDPSKYLVTNAQQIQVALHDQAAKLTAVTTFKTNSVDYQNYLVNQKKSSTIQKDANTEYIRLLNEYKSVKIPGAVYEYITFDSIDLQMMTKADLEKVIDERVRTILSIRGTLPPPTTDFYIMIFEALLMALSRAYNELYEIQYNYLVQKVNQIRVRNNTSTSSGPPQNFDFDRLEEYISSLQLTNIQDKTFVEALSRQFEKITHKELLWYNDVFLREYPLSQDIKAAFDNETTLKKEKFFFDYQSDGYTLKQTTKMNVFGIERDVTHVVSMRKMMECMKIYALRTYLTLKDYQKNSNNLSRIPYRGNERLLIFCCDFLTEWKTYQKASQAYIRYLELYKDAIESIDRADEQILTYIRLRKNAGELTNARFQMFANKQHNNSLVVNYRPDANIKYLKEPYREAHPDFDAFVAGQNALLKDEYPGTGETFGDLSNLAFKNSKEMKTFRADVLAGTMSKPSFQYHYGPFTKVFMPDDVNTDIAKKCREISTNLLEGKNVFILGYGASGAGKTSTLVYRAEGVGQDKNGIIVHLLNSEEITKKYKTIEMTVFEFIQNPLDGSDTALFMTHELTPPHAVRKTGASNPIRHPSYPYFKTVKTLHPVTGYTDKHLDRGQISKDKVAMSNQTGEDKMNFDIVIGEMNKLYVPLSRIGVTISIEVPELISRLQNTVDNTATGEYDQTVLSDIKPYIKAVYEILQLQKFYDTLSTNNTMANLSAASGFQSDVNKPMTASQKDDAIKKKIRAMNLKDYINANTQIPTESNINTYIENMMKGWSLGNMYKAMFDERRKIATVEQLKTSGQKLDPTSDGKSSCIRNSDMYSCATMQGHVTFTLTEKEFVLENDFEYISQIMHEKDETYATHHVSIIDEENEYRIASKNYAGAVKNERAYLNKFKKDSSIGEIISFMVDKDRLVSTTTNNPQSSRSHVLIQLKLFDEKNPDDFVFCFVGDFAGLENTFKCDDNDDEVVNILKVRRPNKEKPFYNNEQTIVEMSNFNAGTCGEKILKNKIVKAETETFETTLKNFKENLISYTKNQKELNEMLFIKDTNGVKSAFVAEVKKLKALKATPLSDLSDSDKKWKSQYSYNVLKMLETLTNLVYTTRKPMNFEGNKYKEFHDFMMWSVDKERKPMSMKNDELAAADFAIMKKMVQSYPIQQVTCVRDDELNVMIVTLWFKPGNYEIGNIHDMDRHEKFTYIVVSGLTTTPAKEMFTKKWNGLQEVSNRTDESISYKVKIDRTFSMDVDDLPIVNPTSKPTFERGFKLSNDVTDSEGYFMARFAAIVSKFTNKITLDDFKKSNLPVMLEEFYYSAIYDGIQDALDRLIKKIKPSKQDIEEVGDKIASLLQSQYKCIMDGMAAYGSNFAMLVHKIHQKLQDRNIIEKSTSKTLGGNNVKTLNEAINHAIGKIYLDKTNTCLTHLKEAYEVIEDLYSTKSEDEKINAYDAHLLYVVMQKEPAPSEALIEGISVSSVFKTDSAVISRVDEAGLKIEDQSTFDLIAAFISQGKLHTFFEMFLYSTKDYIGVKNYSVHSRNEILASNATSDAFAVETKKQNQLDKYASPDFKIVDVSKDTDFDVLTRKLNFAASEINRQNKELDDAKQAARQICACRVYEGRFINKSVFTMKEQITMSFAKNDLIKVPKYLRKCDPYQCNPTYQNCFVPTTDTAKSAAFDIMAEIKRILKYSYNGDDDKTRVVMCVFCVVNISGRANDPPTIPYIDLRSLREMKHQLSIINSNSFMKFLLDMTKEQTGNAPSAGSVYASKAFETSKLFLAELNKDAKYNWLFSFHDKYKRMLWMLDQWIKYYLNPITFKVSVKVSKNGKDTTEIQDQTQESALVDIKEDLFSRVRDLSSYESMDNIRQYADAIIDKCGELITLLDNSNSISVLGTIEFTDAMAKYNYLTMPCVYQACDPDEKIKMASFNTDLKMYSSVTKGGLVPKKKGPTVTFYDP